MPTGLHDPKQDKRCENCKWWKYLENSWKLNVCSNWESAMYVRLTESTTICKYWQSKEEE